MIEGARWAKLEWKDGRTASITGFRKVVPSRDIAILSATANGGGLALAASNPLQGDRVLAFGSPVGLSGTVTDGIVNAIRTGSEIRSNAQLGDIYVSAELDVDATWIQTSCDITHGNSGGPLVDMQGRVVGVNTWGLPASGNFNFAISVDDLRKIVREADSRTQSFASLPPAREDKAIAEARERDRLLGEEAERERLADAARIREANARGAKEEQRIATQLELNRLNDRIVTVKAELAAIEIEGTALTAERSQAFALGQEAVVRWNQIAVRVTVIQRRLAQIGVEVPYGWRTRGEVVVRPLGMGIVGRKTPRRPRGSRSLARRVCESDCRRPRCTETDARGLPHGWRTPHRGPIRF